MSNNKSLKIKEISYYKAKKEDGEVVKNGKPITAHDIKLFYDDSGNLLKKELFNADGTLRSIRTFKYDKNNQKTEEIELDSQGFRNLKFVFEYDTRGLLQKKSIIDADDFISSYWLYDYESNHHNLSEEKRYGLRNKLVDRKTYNYDKAHNLIAIELFNFEGKTDHKWTRIYDMRNNCIKEIETDIETNKTFIKERAYSEKNQEIERKIYAANGALSSIQNFSYDNCNNLIKEVYKNKAGQVQIRKNYSYTLDDSNNWIVKIEFNGNTPVLITERQFL